MTNATGAETLPLVVANALKEITTADFANSTVVAEAIRDIIGSTLVAGTNVTITVDDTANTITIAATGGGTSWDAEQTRDTIAAALVGGAGTTITVNDASDTITITAGAGATYTAENARDDIGAALVGETNYLTVTPDDTGDRITIAVDPFFKSAVLGLGPSTLIQANDSTGTTTSTAIAVLLPGTAGNYVSTPSAAPLNVAGNFEACVRVSLNDWTPTGGNTVFAKYTTTGNQRSWRIDILSTGIPRFVSCTDGTSTTAYNTDSANAPVFTDATAYWLKVTRNSTSGDVSFYTAADQDTEPTSWTPLSTGRTSAPGVLFASTAVLEAGTHTAGTGQPMGGKVYRALLKSTIAGSIVADLNPTSWTTGTTWVAVTGETWTLQGTASMVLGSSSATSNTTAQFSLAETAANTEAGLQLHDTILWFTTFALINTSGASATFTFVLQINGVTLFTFPAQTLTSVAASVRTGTCALRLAMNQSNGTSQIASVELVIGNAVTGTIAGSATAATDFVRLTGNLSVTALTTFVTMPTIALKLTMGTAATTISAQRGFTQLFLAKA